MVVRARVLWAGVLGAIAVAAVIVVALLSGGGAGSAEATDVHPDIKAVMSIFEGARTAEDEMELDPVSAVNSSGDKQPGERPDLSRRVTVPPGQEAFVWPKDEGVCFASAGGNGCVGIDKIRDEGVAVGSQQQIDTAAGRFTDVNTFGLARDGITRVVLHFEDGAELPVDVVDNAFLVVGGDDIPVAVSWSDDSGTHRVTTNEESPEAVLDSIARDRKELQGKQE